MDVSKAMPLRSAGELQLLRAFCVAGIAGGLVGGFLLFDPLSEQGGMSLYRLWLGVAGAFGAATSLFLVRKNFGKPGTFGAFETAFAGLMATLLTGIIGGSLALPVYGTMFGAWLVIVSIVETPLLLLPWAGALWVMHQAMSTYRAEKQTLMDWEPPEPPTAPEDPSPYRGARDPEDAPAVAEPTAAHRVAGAKPSPFRASKPPRKAT